MSALVPRNYGNFSPQSYFNSFKQKKNHYNDKKFLGQQPFFPLFQPSPYQTYFFPTNGYPTTGYNQYGRSGVHSTSLIHSNRFDDQYKNTWPYMNKMQKWYGKQQDTGVPLSYMNTRSSPLDYTNEPIYQYEREVRYVPFPIYIGPGGSRVRTPGNLEYGYTSGLGYPGRLNTTVRNFGPASSLPPKIRVIFIPQASPSFQQSCGSPLAMPSFLFNRMAQPYCSLPVPPPLPQIGSLPLTPAIQQMVMQQYANPVAVLPFTPNWPISQPIMPPYPPVSQQQQQSMMVTSAWQQYQSASQPYIHPSLMPSNIPPFPSNASPSLPFPDPTSSIPQNPYNSYPNTCRACVPVPPSLTIQVTGHCWIQHCSACHHIPADTTNPNVRSSNGRITPLLRHPIVEQNVRNQRTQQEQYPHINPSGTTRPWLHQMPPLPSGAVIISDEYITKNDLVEAHHSTQNYPIEHPIVQKSLPRSVTITTNSTEKDGKNEYRLPKKRHKKQKDSNKSELKDTSNNTSSISYSYTPNKPSSSTASEYSSSVIEDEKPEINPNNNQQSLAHKQLSTLIRKIELRYNHQTSDMQAVYHTNDYLKSSDEDSASLSNSTASSNLSITTESDHNSVPLSISFNSMKEDTKSIHTLSPTPLQSEQPKRRLIIIRQFRTDSPSTISTISSNLSLIITNKDCDSTSTTSTITPDKVGENDANSSEMH